MYNEIVMENPKGINLIIHIRLVKLIAPLFDR